MVSRVAKRAFVIGWILASFVVTASAQEPAIQPIVEIVASGLLNPRGVAVLADGSLIVAQAGTGQRSNIEERRTGSISFFEDLNGDGDYNDPGEIIPIIDHLNSYNALTQFGSGHDEVGGVGDLVVLEDEHIFYTWDDPPAGVSPEEVHISTTGIYWIDSGWQSANLLIERGVTNNAIVYDPNRETFFIAESGLDRIHALSPAGEITATFNMPMLDNRQHPVPAGMTIDPSTGDLLVALFSGWLPDYYGTILAFMPGDSKIVRVNPDTGTITDEITGLTTAVDVASDEEGNIYVVEFTTTWPSDWMPQTFNLYDPDAPPDVGGYVRYTGRVTLYPADGGDPLVLADGLDEPSNITYHDGFLYVSTGQGTPGRRVISPDGTITTITGEIYRISGFLAESQ